VLPAGASGFEPHPAAVMSASAATTDKTILAFM
jgi:hypothetical protein